MTMTTRDAGAPLIGYVTDKADLRAYLDAADSERAADEACNWIKALRQLPVDGLPLRDRFTYRGDSLWWFAELYLHKQGVIDDLWRTAIALETLCQRHRPTSLVIGAADASLALLAPQVAKRYGARCEIAQTAPSGGTAGSSRLALDLKSRFYTWTALASRVRGGRRSAGHASGGSRTDAGARAGGTLAFVHSAFWRKPAAAARTAGTAGTAEAARDDEGREGYMGDVLRKLQERREAQPVQLVGVGPRTNFKARRWWHAIAPSRAGAGDMPVTITPIEQFASWSALAGSRAIWRERFAMERALLASDAIRAHATVLGYDVWPIVAEELRGVARLQFPWSARAMDEAAAAMDELQPRLVVTYAEAGGWGRALMLEARRRGIPSAGLQHGFIYRHWLNYRHEPDEMAPSPNNAADRGFPRPDLTLVYDGYAARHLTQAGHFPKNALRVTGSPALDALAASVARIDEPQRARIREQLAVTPGDHVIVLVTKFTQIGDALTPLIEAVSSLSGVRLVIKPHPAETADPYREAAADAPRVTVAPVSLDLAKLLAVARLVITVNSTVAIDAITLGIPSLIVRLPNNLSPFVAAGVMADGSDPTQLRTTLHDVMCNETCRAEILTRARAFAAEHAIQADGHAAARAVDAMLELQR
jgi:hypothetical protein